MKFIEKFIILFVFFISPYVANICKLVLKRVMELLDMHICLWLIANQNIVKLFGVFSYSLFNYLKKIISNSLIIIFNDV